MRPLLCAATSGLLFLSFSGDSVRSPDARTRILLIEAQEQQVEDVIVLVAARSGAIATAARALVLAGGAVLARYDDVDYLRARVPLRVAPHLLMLPGIEEYTIDVGQAFPRTMPLSTAGPGPRDSPPSSTAPIPRLSAAALADPRSPYLAAGMLRVPEFRLLAPQGDGRGTTVAIIEGSGGTSIDYRTPGLQHALTAEGRSIGKLAEQWDMEALLGLDRLSSSSLFWRYAAQYPARVRLDVSQMSRADTLVTVNGETYRLPRAAQFNAGTWQPYYQGLPKGAPHRVVWDEAQTVWIDTDRDRDFRDEVPLTDINTSALSGRPIVTATLTGIWRTPISIAAAFNGEPTPMVYLGVQLHAAMTASAATGSRYLGSSAGSAAPGARVVLIQPGPAGDGDASATSLAAMLEGILRAERDPRIDVVSISHSVGAHYLAPVLRLVVARAVARHGKPIFVAAGNDGPAALGSLSEHWIYAGVPGVATIGAFASQENVRAWSGHTIAADVVIPFSARGPAADGAMVPTLVAPYTVLTADVCRGPGGSDRLPVQLPDCYQLGGGTSNAAPTAAGAAAALISAAKQSGIPHHAERVLWALRASARWLADFGVHEQGNGLVQLDSAWQLLQTTRSVVPFPVIRSEGPVRTTWAADLPVPGRGPGIFEREGWTVGDTGARTVLLTRTTGPAGPRSYRLSWLGNTHGTFQVDSLVTLARDLPTPVRLRIEPRRSGIASAYLTVIDPAVPVGAAPRRPVALPVAWVPVTIVAMPRAQAAYEMEQVVEITRGPMSTVSHVRVPESAAALRLTYTPRTAGLPQGVEHTAIRGSRLHLEAWPLISDQDMPRVGTRRVRGLTPAVDRTVSLLVPVPSAGIWEFGLWAFDYPEPVAPAMKTVGWLSAERYDFRVTSLLVTGAGSRSDSGLTFRFTNRGGPLMGAATRFTLGARRTSQARVMPPTAADSAGTFAKALRYEIQVDSGTTAMRLATRIIPERGRTEGAVTLLLYDCATAECRLADIVPNGRTRPDRVVYHPSPGRWLVVLDPVTIPAAGMTVEYTEVLDHPRYGQVSGRDTLPRPRASGAEWLEHARVTVASGGSLPARRELVAVAEVLDVIAERENENPFDESIPPSAVGAVIVPLSLANR